MNLNLTDRQIAEGRRLLKGLLPRLRKEVSLASPDGIMQPTSLIGQSLMGRIGHDNLDALVIRRSSGGWHADVVLTGMPLGVSNVMGTPEARPLPSREAALEAGTGILRQLCRLAAENALAGRDQPLGDTRPFELHGHTFQIPGPVVEQVRLIWAAMGKGLVPDAQAARNLLTENLVRTMRSDSFDPDRYAALSDDEKSSIGISMATLLQFGEFRHPDRPVAAPAHEEDPSP